MPRQIKAEELHYEFYEQKTLKGVLQMKKVHTMVTWGLERNECFSKCKHMPIINTNIIMICKSALCCL